PAPGDHCKVPSKVGSCTCPLPKHCTVPTSIPTAREVHRCNLTTVDRIHLVVSKVGDRSRLGGNPPAQRSQQQHAEAHDQCSRPRQLFLSSSRLTDRA